MHILQYLLILQVKLWWVRNQLIISSSTCPVLVFDFWSALGKNLSTPELFCLIFLFSWFLYLVSAFSIYHCGKIALVLKASPHSSLVRCV